MPSYIIKGECDDALAKLKTTLKAQDAKFEATLQSQFNLPAAPPRKPVAAAQPTPPQKPAAAAQPMPPQKPAAAAQPVPPRQTGAAFAAPTGNSASATGSTTGSMLSSKRDADDSVRGRLRTSLRSTSSR